MDFFLGTAFITLVIIAIGFIASGKFGTLADVKGYVAVKAKRYPWVIAGATFSLMLLGQTMLSFFVNAYILLGWGVFAVVLMITVLRKAYKNMQQAPDRGELTEMDEEESEELDEEEN